MKTMRNFLILAVLSLVLFALGATKAGARNLGITKFGGTITLPFEAQWGEMILPAGDYSLYYGILNPGGSYLVEVVGNEQGSPHGFIVVQGRDQTSETKNVLVCVREGNIGFVRELRMADIGESVSFALPHGVEVRSKLIAKHRDVSGNAQLAETRIRIERVRVNVSGR